MKEPFLSFRGWQGLSPDEAAREVRRRSQTLMPPLQQRAAIASLRGEVELAAEFERGRGAGPLGGVPYFLKDMFPIAGEPMLAGSTFLPEVRPPAAQDGALVLALRGAGAVLAGRSHMHEFAYGITGENPHYGDCENPRFPGRTSGGSSSGSAALVASGIVPFAIGSDTGGSIRVPAAFCGVFGFRLAPRNDWIKDAFPLASSFDTAGWFTAAAADMRLAIEALVGAPGVAVDRPRGIYLEMPGLDADVAEACRVAVERLAPAADSSARSDLQRAFSSALETYNTVAVDEAWAVHRPWAERYRERYDPGVWQRLNRVHAITGAQREAARLDFASIQGAWARYFLEFDFLVMPASPCAALLKRECTPENRSRLLSLTAPASVGGLPVLTVPVVLPSGLTTGLQIVVPSPLSPIVAWALERFGD